MIDYAKQKTVYDQQAKVLAGELAIAEAAVADNAAKIDVAMQSIPSAVEAIRARFAQLTSPTQELIQRVSQLDAEMRAVSDARTDQEKIAAYQKLAETIKYCRTEITNLSTAQRKDILDVKFTAGLEKAKADLATIENLFGKRQAQVGAAILSNFDQARKSIETMETSAGSAGREMEKIMDSLDYKINALKETWTGVAQNLFQQEDLKLVIEALTTLSNLIDALTSKHNWISPKL